MRELDPGSVPLLAVRNVSKTYQVGGTAIAALSDVSLTLEANECHAIVGESGSGKSTLSNIILGIVLPSAGTIELDGTPLPQARPTALKRAIQFVQQNPMGALNPRIAIRDCIRRGLDVHGIGHPSDRWERVNALLAEVGLDPKLGLRRPRDLSGGQRQRVAIARAIACEPRIIVLDEPTSALDVLVQARVLELLTSLKERHSVSYLFITHDLPVVAAISNRVTVLSGGRVVEAGTTSQVLSAPGTRYTKQLLASVPAVSEEDVLQRSKFKGELENEGTL